MTGFTINTAKVPLNRLTYIVTTEAAAWIAIYFYGSGEEMASRVIERMGEGNESRWINGLSPRNMTQLRMSGVSLDGR